MSTCEATDLEALAYGELLPREAKRAASHAQACPACAAELKLLHAERRRFQERRTAPSLAHVRRAVERRLDAAPPRSFWNPRWVSALALGTGLALALALAVPSRPGPSVPCATGPCGPDPRAQEIALEEADFGACLVATPCSDELSVCCYAP